MNLAQLEAEVYRRLRYPADPAAPVKTRIRAILNETHRELASLPGLERLRDDTFAITALSTIPRTGLPPSVARINGITDRTNNFKLRQVPLIDLRLRNPSQTDTSSYPELYAVIGNQAVQRQPTAATGLWVASDSASDTTQLAYVESILTGGYPHDATANGTTLNGVTRVAIGARTDHLQVTRFYLDTAAVGFVSLYDAAAAGNELARLPIGQLWSRYISVEWWPIPTADVTEYADITHRIYDLVRPGDEPLLPPDFHETVVAGALMREYMLTDQSQAVIMRTEFARMKDALSSWVMNDGDRIASLRPVPGRWSGLTAGYSEHY